jgi:hypothetical protein
MLWAVTRYLGLMINACVHAPFQLVPVWGKAQGGVVRVQMLYVG